jgi:phosphinothricin acetyltransferase
MEAAIIRPAEARDAEAIARIYNHYVRSTTITFEEQEVTPKQMADRMADVRAAALPWLALVRDGAVAGYAYASPWRTRSAYRFTVETSVYVDHAQLGQNFGHALYEALLPLLRERGVHAVVACLGLPNPASVALHERCGFRHVGDFPEVGYKFGAWLDVGYWQLLF